MFINMMVLLQGLLVWEELIINFTLPFVKFQHVGDKNTNTSSSC